MITHEDMMESSYYRYIWEQGLEKGIGQGKAELLRRQLERRFGSLPSWAVEKIKGADLDMVETWGMRLLDAPGSGLEDLLA